MGRLRTLSWISPLRPGSCSFTLREPQCDPPPESPPPAQGDGALRLPQVAALGPGSAQDTATLGTEPGVLPGSVASGKATGTAAGLGELRVFPVLRRGTEKSSFLFQDLRLPHPLAALLTPQSRFLPYGSGPALGSQASVVGCSSPCRVLGAGVVGLGTG